MHCAVSRGQYVTKREQELEDRDPASLNPKELAELYNLQIQSASKEIAIRDRHLALLSKNVEDARALAKRKHDAAVEFGALSHCALAPNSAGQPLCNQPVSFASFR